VYRRRVVVAYTVQRIIKLYAHNIYYHTYSVHLVQEKRRPVFLQLEIAYILVIFYTPCFHRRGSSCGAEFAPTHHIYIYIYINYNYVWLLWRVHITICKSFDTDTFLINMFVHGCVCAFAQYNNIVYVYIGSKRIIIWKSTRGLRFDWFRFCVIILV